MIYGLTVYYMLVSTSRVIIIINKYISHYLTMLLRVDDREPSSISPFHDFSQKQNQQVM